MKRKGLNEEFDKIEVVMEMKLVRLAKERDRMPPKEQAIENPNSKVER
jgi:hypothetical protein